VPSLAVLIAGSPSPAFFSQVAAIATAFRTLNWSRWEPRICLFLAGKTDLCDYERWLPHLEDVDISFASSSRFRAMGDWAQSDDVFISAPRDAEVILAMDADVLPITALEDIAETIAGGDLVAGTIAHAPFPGSSSPRDDWDAVADGFLARPLAFDYRYSLVRYPDSRDAASPFYVNFGAVFFSHLAFERLAPQILAIRSTVAERMLDPDFSAQVALTIAIAMTRVRTLALPMRYNFPNDPLADELYSEELRFAKAIHYLRTEQFDRHRIFVSDEEYARFLDLPLAGSNRIFQDAVRRMLGPSYPFQEG
jgi:hypothetical protein